MSWIFMGFCLALGWWLFNKVKSLATDHSDTIISAVKDGYESAKDKVDK